MDTQELTDKILALQTLLNEKENEWIQYVSTHEIPQDLRSLLIEWAELKNQVGEAMKQLTEAYRVKEESFKQRSQETQERIKEIESQYQALGIDLDAVMP